MKITQNSDICLFFGDASTKLFPEKYTGFSGTSILKKEPFLKICKQMPLEHLVVLKQMHKNKGMVIEAKKELKAFPFRTKEGDFLVTSCAGIGLAVVTADCLPIIFWDTKHKLVAIAHAGWRGSIVNIARKTVDSMVKNYKTKLEDLEVFFGPCAKACCYQVDQAFIDSLSKDRVAKQVLTQKDNNWYFDLPGYNKIKLIQLGIAPEALHFESNECTMCTPSYCSYRRQSGTLERNITIVSLKS